MKGIEVKNLTKSFGKDILFEGANLSLPAKGLFLILGESGSGKSTLFEMLSGIDGVFDGRIVCFGRDLKTLNEAERGLFRLNNVGILRQGFDLLPHETVLENAILPVSRGGRDRKKNVLRAKALLQDVGLKEKIDAPAFALSGGEKQRLAFVRALLGDPSLLLCDEPTAALDEGNATLLAELLSKEAKERLVVINTHDPLFFWDYADGVFEIENRKIIAKKPVVSKIDALTGSLSNEKQSFSPFYWLRHALHLLNAKKLRSVFSSLLLSFSFLGFGLSVFLGRNAEGKLSKAFEGILGERAITMSLKNETGPVLGSVFSASKESVEALLSTWPEQGSLCVSYLSSFEQIFKDQNAFSFKLGARRYEVASLSGRSVNDFYLLSDFSSRPIFPSSVSTLEVDEVVLGLPKSEMASLSRFLQVEPSFERVASKLVLGGVPLILTVENDDWGYFDVQTFYLKGLMEFEVPTFFHVDPLWNEIIFEERMRLPSSDGSSFPTPWTLHKAYGIKGIKDEEAFLKRSREFPFSDYLFERDSERFDSSHNEREKRRGDCRYFVFLADRYGIRRDDIESGSSLSGVSSFCPLPEGVYRSFPSALSSGFKEPFILGASKQEVLEVSDALSRVPKKAIASFPSVPKTVSIGSYLRMRQESLSFSSDLSALSSGREPQSIDEIVLSSSLYERLSCPEAVFVSGAVASSSEGDFHLRDYRSASLKVVGVSSLSGDCLLSSPYWLSDFFVSRLGMSSVLLEPRECLFYPKKGGERHLLKALSSRLPSYSFLDPSASIGESLEDTMGYLSSVLSFASVSCLLSSFLLLLILSSLYLAENKGEGRYLFLLGVSKSAIFDSYFAGVFLLLGSGFLTAVSSLFAIEFAFDEALSASFGVPFSFSFDFYSLFAVFLAFVFSLFAVSLFIRFSLWRSDYSKRDG